MSREVGPGVLEQPGRGLARGALTIKRDQVDLPKRGKIDTDRGPASFTPSRSLLQNGDPRSLKTCCAGRGTTLRSNKAVREASSPTVTGSRNLGRGPLRLGGELVFLHAHDLSPLTLARLQSLLKAALVGDVGEHTQYQTNAEHLPYELEPKAGQQTVLHPGKKQSRSNKIDFNTT